MHLVKMPNNVLQFSVYLLNTSCTVEAKTMFYSLCRFQHKNGLKAHVVPRMKQNTESVSVQYMS